MAPVIYSDQENGDVNAALLSRDRAQLSGAGKSLVKSHQGKVRSSASSGKTSRKALGNVNKQVMTQKNGQPLKGDQKVPKPAPAVIQVSGTSDKTDEQQYPDIEKFVPYNPAGGCDGVLGLLLRFHPMGLTSDGSSRLLLQLLQPQHASFVLERNMKTQEQIEEQLGKLGLLEEQKMLIVEVMGEDLLAERTEEGQTDTKTTQTLASYIIASDAEFRVKWFQKATTFLMSSE